MKGSLSGLIDHADKLVGQAGRLTAWLGLGLVLLVAFDVLARYLFAYGLVALQELEWHLLAVTMLIGMSFTLHRGDEVRVDILYARFGPWTQALVRLLSAVLTLAISVIVIKLSLPYVGQSLAMNEGSPDPGGLPYRFVLKSFIPLGFALLALQALVQVARTAQALLQSQTNTSKSDHHGN
ncbi:TRAP transporter small permease subunit [Dichotomicrobium thermohalophilum]|uniref:TRAP transporter small permease protein n=1 Tax=Dichotomicrobium thermohalophilum TaxID=933063 RepID=A0A397Q392_9HYPH|nr:TRAP transporter small permease subunit [Dichotomicrobium thermohalophilum]RIA55393.1 TRAP-type mannitol/chloroaromatic compound transport system permease small subunit [Dichotomicrobium thermohalophilum]